MGIKQRNADMKQNSDWFHHIRRCFTFRPWSTICVLVAMRLNVGLQVRLICFPCLVGILETSVVAPGLRICLAEAQAGY